MTKTPWGPVGYITYKRTYSRNLNDQGKKEEFEDTIDRIVKACRTQLKIDFDGSEEEELRGYLLGLKGMVAGRFLWQLGTKTVSKLGLFSLQNCAVTVVNEPIRPFTWAMDALMLGSGVGYNIQKEFVYELPKPKRVKIVRQDTNDADFIVPDSREGWVSLLEKVLEAHFVTGKSFTYSTVCVRGKGAAIKGFGGVAGGAEELCWGMEQISTVINARAGKKIRPIDALDIMNIIGFVVVSGNVRRSAQLALGDADDLQFLNAKRWDLGGVPNWRAMSNNSVVCNDIAKLPSIFWEGYNGNGEPYGLINLKLSQSVGRLGDSRYPDPNVVGYNPCAEQSLEPYETCCLAEVFLPNIESKEELFRVVSMLYRINKHSLLLDCHHSETKAIVHKNMRMGIGVTGYLQATDKQRSWLAPTYEKLRKLDVDYSEKIGVAPSIKLTTCKPSGTLSLLFGCTPGVHPAFSQFFIRRIRIASNSELVNVCRKSGYTIEFQKNFDGTEDKNTVVVEFPCSYPLGTVLAKDTSAISQLEWVKKLQTDWSDNSVSCTVYYKKEELSEIKLWLNKNYDKSLKTVSFLLHTDHGFLQAPFEEISEEIYINMISKSLPIDSLESMEMNDIKDELECSSGACPVR